MDPEIYHNGSLVYIFDYDFGGGHERRNKYLLILKVDNANLMILQLLTTSKNYLPSDIQIELGCVNIPDRFLSAYIFPQNVEICSNGESFEKDTFIYFQSNIDFLHYSNLEVYNIDDRLEYVGTLKEPELEKIKNCIIASEMTPQKYVRMLS